MRRGAAGWLAVLLAAPPLAAQWRVGAELGSLRFWGNAIDTTVSADRPNARPSPLASYALEVERRAGALALGLTVRHGRGGAGVENRSVAIDEKGLLKLYEIAPQVALRIATPGHAGALRLRGGPLFDRWTFAGGTPSSRVGAHAAMSLEWPLGGRWTARVLAGMAVSAGVFNRDDLPPAFAPRAAWRRGLAAGILFGR
jgi:hypothetical protein